MSLPSASDVDAALDRVLTLPEFQPPVKSWTSSAMEWVQEKVADLLSWVLSQLGAGFRKPGVAPVVTIVLTVLLVVLLARLVWAVLRLRQPPRQVSREPARAPATSLSPEPHLLSASRHALEGGFLEAARALYRGVVLWLDARGHARYQESKTGGEYAREISSPPVRKPFLQLLLSFYPVAYGGRPAVREAYQRMRASASEMGIPE